jgi:hypothetical protein
MQANKVETFDTFNKKMRRPDRRGHMRNCGFFLSQLLHRGQHAGRPAKLTKKRLDALTTEMGGFRHAVLLQYKDYWGWAYYEVWTKDITTGQ